MSTSVFPARVLLEISVSEADFSLELCMSIEYVLDPSLLANYFTFIAQRRYFNEIDMKYYIRLFLSKKLIICRNP